MCTLIIHMLLKVEKEIFEQFEDFQKWIDVISSLLTNLHSIQRASALSKVDGRVQRVTTSYII